MVPEILFPANPEDDCGEEENHKPFSNLLKYIAAAAVVLGFGCGIYLRVLNKKPDKGVKDENITNQPNK